MRKTRIVSAAGGLALLPLLLGPALAGQANRGDATSPLYRVTVVERTVKAINYRYLSGSTQIDFRGTVLLPHAKGQAMVESRQGRTEIDASFHGLTSPQRFGREYLTYVLWAITPEGRPHNIGEVIPGSADKASLRVTTDMQAFAMIVTAEPYSAVRQPSDVVVLENQPRPDTAGAAEPVEAKYELLPRGEYTLHLSNDLDAAQARAPKVSMHEYEAISELYQARNAVAIAGSANAEHYAPETYERARQLLAKAQQLRDRKGDFRQVVESAREAAQTAEDARLIAQRRQQEDQLQTAKAELSRTQAELSSAQRAKEEALDQAQRAQAEADAARTQTEAALAARNRADLGVPGGTRVAPPSPPARAGVTRQAATETQEQAQKRELRMRLLANLKGTLPTLDTPRGLIATVPDDGFQGAAVGDAASAQVARVATILENHAALRVSVEGYSDSAAKAAQSEQRAQAVRHVLIANGVAANRVSAAGRGDSHPLVSNATSQGRKQNSRVEIVISGEPIGSLALWDHRYPLASAAQQPSGGWQR